MEAREACLRLGALQTGHLKLEGKLSKGSLPSYIQPQSMQMYAVLAASTSTDLAEGEVRLCRGKFCFLCNKGMQDQHHGHEETNSHSVPPKKGVINNDSKALSAL